MWEDNKLEQLHFNKKCTHCISLTNSCFFFLIDLDGKSGVLTHLTQKRKKHIYVVGLAILQTVSWFVPSWILGAYCLAKFVNIAPSALVYGGCVVGQEKLTPWTVCVCLCVDKGIIKHVELF